MHFFIVDIFRSVTDLKWSAPNKKRPKGKGLSYHKYFNNKDGVTMGQMKLEGNGEKGKQKCNKCGVRGIRFLIFTVFQKAIYTVVYYYLYNSHNVDLFQHVKYKNKNIFLFVFLSYIFSQLRLVYFVLILCLFFY